VTAAENERVLLVANMRATEAGNCFLPMKVFRKQTSINSIKQNWLSNRFNADSSSNIKENIPW
jgi:hypothetical protein